MKAKRSIWIPVVAALVRKGSMVLLGKRPFGHPLGGLWEFPGGKIETGETPEQALRRELSEELDIDCEIGELRHACAHNYGDRSVLILFYEVNFWKGEPKSIHHIDIAWFKSAELDSIDVPEANRIALKHLKKFLR